MVTQYVIDYELPYFAVVTIGFLATTYTTDECAGCSVLVRIGMTGSDLQRNVTFTLSTQDDTAIG